MQNVTRTQDTGDHEDKSYLLWQTKWTSKPCKTGFLVLLGTGLRSQGTIGTLHGRGSVVSTVSSRRMYVSPKQLDHFLDFITNVHIVQDLPFGEKKLKLSTKEEIAVPNVIRTLIPERIVQQYNAFWRESGFVPMAPSTLLAILNVCSASTRNSLQGLDYFTAQGAKAFEDLEGVVEEIGEKCGKGSLWAKEKKEQLKSAKRYLKGDYKVLVFLVNCFILNCTDKKKRLSHFVILIRLI